MSLRSSLQPVAWVVASILCTMLVLGSQVANKPVATLRAGKIYRLEVARTKESRELGLSKRENMMANHGMIFIFDTPSVQCFWMKDMRFPLDIIWLDSTKQVTNIQANVQVETYPKSFCPSSPAKFVIELNAGQTKYARMHLGERLDLRIPENN